MKRLALIALLLASACREDAAAVVPEAVTMSRDAIGHYCQMNLAEHGGPKGQIHLGGVDNPIFFAQVRDALAFLHEPERTAPVVAVYLSNMSRAPSWDEPGNDNWLLADAAWFTVGSDVAGGMGAPEIVPFETKQDALKFAAEHGGLVMRLDDIPAAAVLSAIDRVLSSLEQRDRR